MPDIQTYVLNQSNLEKIMKKDFKFYFVLSLILITCLSFILGTVTIPTGYVGLRVLFGKVQDGYLEPGFHVINPFAQVIKMNIRTQKADEEGIDKNLLDWKGIEATEIIAKSPNAKIIIIGNKESGGLPLILPSSKE